MGSSKKVIVGYWYGLGFHSVFCHGPVDAVTEIIVGERTVWSGSATANTDLTLANRKLFGGQEREGGIDGRARLRFGADGQIADPYLASKLGAVPGFLGVLSLIWDGLVSANNPYIKPWSVRARRIPKAWYSAKATIASSEANPAHIIRECITNATWGMGYPEADIDSASFTAAADALYSESFGLSLLWQDEMSIEDFVSSILRHIDGVLFVDAMSGLFKLRLARADYTAGTLPVFGPSAIARIDEFARLGWGDVVNEVTVIYRDATTDKDIPITVQDLAGIERQGGVVSTTVRLPGIALPALANRVAMRELRQLSAMLAKVTFVVNRTASALNIGDVFKLTWPAYGITEMIMRVVQISYGERTAGQIRIEAVQDIFGLPAAVYADPPATGWVDPITAPAAAPYRQLVEAPYWIVARELAGDSDSLLAEILPDEGFVQVLAARPSSDAYAFGIVTRISTGAAWDDRGEGSFAPTATLAADIAQGAVNVIVALTAGLSLDEVTIEADTLALIDGELFQVIALNLTTSEVTLARGMVDTVPAAHATGARIWFFEATPIVEAPFLVGDTVRVRALPRTPLGALDVTSAPENTTGISRRFIKPYPPGNVKLNAVAYPTAVAGDLVITWATRNRKTQTGALVLQTAGSITAETGQTTTVRIRNKLGTLVRTYSAIAGTSQTWSVAQAITDAGVNGDTVTVEVESARDSYASSQFHSIQVQRAGYGMRYGQYYGGI